MKLSAEIKKHFRNLGIPVRVRTVAVKNPFCQVWIKSEGDGIFSHGPVIYKYEFPVEMRERLLKIIYGPTWQSLPGREGSAGNVNSHSFSCSESEWRELAKEENAPTITA